MDEFSCALIDALGGTAIVARAMDAPASTVSNMRTRLTSSRLNHLRRIAALDRPTVDVDAIAAQFGVALPPIVVLTEPSRGNADEISAEVAA